jgi:tripartite-type tricarboxylate transporter receptor subunit TctC
VAGGISEEKAMKRISWITVAVALAGIAPAHAQYPTKTVRLVVPFPAGSGNDTVARFVQPQFATALGQATSGRRWPRSRLRTVTR